MARDLQRVINVFIILIKKYDSDNKVESHSTIENLEELKEDTSFTAPEIHYLRWQTLQEILIEYVEFNKFKEDSVRVNLLKNIFSDKVNYKTYENT